jgi:hypothetical protein
VESEFITVGSVMFKMGKHYVTRCPMAIMNEMPWEDRKLIWRLLNYYSSWERGILPKAGGYDDQDEFVMSCMPIISKLYSEAQATEGK